MLTKRYEQHYEGRWFGYGGVVDMISAAFFIGAALWGAYTNKLNFGEILGTFAIGGMLYNRTRIRNIEKKP